MGKLDGKTAVVTGASSGIGLAAAQRLAAEGAPAGLAEGIPIGRLGRPEEVAGAVAFLASADSSFIYGSNLDIDGGEHQF